MDSRLDPGGKDMFDEGILQCPVRAGGGKPSASVVSLARTMRVGRQSCMAGSPIELQDTKELQAMNLSDRPAPLATPTRQREPPVEQGPEAGIG